jgi:hypothetical protein
MLAATGLLFCVCVLLIEDSGVAGCLFLFLPKVPYLYSGEWPGFLSCNDDTADADAAPAPATCVLCSDFLPEPRSSEFLKFTTKGNAVFAKTVSEEEREMDTY